MKLSLSAELVEIAEENNNTVVLDRPGYLLVLHQDGYGDSYFIEDRDTGFAVLLRGERSTTLTIEVEATRLIDAEKYLAARLLSGWRHYKLKLPRFSVRDQIEDPKPGCYVELYPNSDRATVIWADGALKASFQLDIYANEFTYYQDASFGQMRAAYADLDGAPLFPPPTKPEH